MQKFYFQEEQQLDLRVRLLLLLVAVGTTASLGYGLYRQLVLGIPWGDSPMKDLDLVIFASSIGLSTWIVFLVFFLAKFTIRITDEGIFVKFPPFQFKNKHISPESILRYEIRRYRPLWEYGGFGVKESIRKSGKAYIATGNHGLQIYLNDGKKLLLGTQKPDSIKLAVGRLITQREAG
jgi:hypothetical protein